MFPLRFSVTRVVREPGGVDALGDTVYHEHRVNVMVAGWAVPESGEPVLAGHERQQVRVNLYAPPGVFTPGDGVVLPGYASVFEVLGTPLSFEANPFGWSPGLVVVELGVIE